MQVPTVQDTLAAITPAARKDEALALDALFRELTGWQPALWGKNLIGYGQYHYTYDSGREGDALATGFAIRSGKFALYIQPGYNAFPQIAARLGPHTRGAGCWYIKRLADVDRGALADLITAGLADLRAKYPVRPDKT